MKKITRKSLGFGTVFFITALIGLQAQVLMKTVSLENQITNSDLVVEGKVISKRSTWDNNYKQIYTINTVEVYKVFKGQPISTIQVMTTGGVVGLQAQISHPSLKLRKGDIGIFTLNNSKIPLSNTAKTTTKQFKPYALSQSFYKYNLIKNVAATPYSKKEGIVNSLYQDIKKITKKDYIEIVNFDVNSKILRTKHSKGLLVPSTLTLDKSTVTAGTKEVLTITGSGFGVTKGKVWFSNADDGGATYISALDSQVTWVSDGEIKVEVPADAGTGDMYVEDSSGGNSPVTSITISYAETNVEFDIDDAGPEPLLAYQVQHSSIDPGTSDSMTWQMHADFANEVSGAGAAFERAFNNWICETEINWEIGATTTTIDVIADDGINVIRFDNGEMDSQTLGTCHSQYGGCIDGGVLKWYVKGLDIEFNKDDVTWYTGTGSPGVAFDLESVALHELGHGHQLGHVIDNTNDVMHYALAANETQRVINTNNSTAANVIQDRSTTSVCGRTALVNNSSCPLSVDENELAEAISIYPNPSRGQFQIKNASFINLEKAVIYDISGREISSYDLTKSSRTKTINMIGVSSGVYFVNIFSERAMITKKVVLE